ncbi:hypothetical protein CVU83_00955 [Candidatus Falkowbacteria bacterium HGW-Falkowbacteria-2]|uniref:Uncharacterized protein n=1 Tax=Candidatus Falkowbacteria bacterium HGW-Falkowbacteria-2 TaxID=2013769 RepID=A0A2N2E2G5_9BACT|nr:MAG: hypothetical protein CVU83_00955 [Candidatus Falkowbacteria bacterium HGW-Falkowbacteria-2]
MSKEETKDGGEELVVEEVKVNHEEEIHKLLKDNITMNKEILAMVRHINLWVAWQRVFGWLKFLLILVSLGIGFLYLPPFIKDSYQQLIDIMKTNAGL